MARITSIETLDRLLAEPAPLGYAAGLFARAPELGCWFGPVTLGQVIGWSVSGSAMRWAEGRLVWDPAAAAIRRVRESVWSDPAGTPLLSPPAGLSPGDLPGGLIDKLIHASDLANGYREPEPFGGSGDSPGAYLTGSSRWLAGLLPQEPEAELCCHAYDFATLAAAEQAAQVAVPGGVLRLDLLSYPTILAASLRTGERADSPLLLDEATAKRLPFGAARALVETADLLSEIGGPDPGLRFRHPDREALGGAGALGAAADRAVPERADRPTG